MMKHLFTYCWPGFLPVDAVGDLTAHGRTMLVDNSPDQSFLTQHATRFASEMTEDKLRVFTPPVEQRLSQAWQNLQHWAYLGGYDWWFFLHADARINNWAIVEEMLKHCRVHNDDTKCLSVIGRLNDCLIAYRTRSVEALGGFDMQFDYSWCDVDMIRRANLAGMHRVILDEKKWPKMVDHDAGAIRRIAPRMRLHNERHAADMLWYIRKWGGFWAHEEYDTPSTEPKPVTWCTPWYIPYPGHHQQQNLRDALAAIPKWATVFVYDDSEGADLSQEPPPRGIVLSLPIKPHLCQIFNYFAAHAASLGAPVYFYQHNDLVLEDQAYAMRMFEAYQEAPQGSVVGVVGAINDAFVLWSTEAVNKLRFDIRIGWSWIEVDFFRRAELAGYRRIILDGQGAPEWSAENVLTVRDKEGRHVATHRQHSLRVQPAFERFRRLQEEHDEWWYIHKWGALWPNETTKVPFEI